MGQKSRRGTVESLSVGYKLFRRTKIGLRSLFIDRNRELPAGVWLEAKDVPTKGYAYRPGWHVLAHRSAPHLSKRGRAWRKVAVKDITGVHHRPKAQGGTWLTAKQIMILEDS